MRAQLAAGKRIADVEIRARVVTRILALPRVERAAIARALGLRLAPRAIERADAVAQKLHRLLGIRVEKERKHEHLRVPKDRALINLPRQRARGNRVRAAGDRCDHEELQEAVAQRVLRLVVAFDDHIAALPFASPLGRVLREALIVAERMRRAHCGDRRLAQRTRHAIVVGEDGEVFEKSIRLPRLGTLSEHAKIAVVRGFGR